MTTRSLTKIAAAGVLALALMVAPAHSKHRETENHLEIVDQFRLAASVMIGFWLLATTVEYEVRKSQDAERAKSHAGVRRFDSGNNITVWHPAPDPLYNLSDLPCAPKTASPSMNLKVRILCW